MSAPPPGKMTNALWQSSHRVEYPSVALSKVQSSLKAVLVECCQQELREAVVAAGRRYRNEADVLKYHQQIRTRFIATCMSSLQHFGFSFAAYFMDFFTAVYQYRQDPVVLQTTRVIEQQLGVTAGTFFGIVSDETTVASLANTRQTLERLHRHLARPQSQKQVRDAIMNQDFRALSIILQSAFILVSTVQGFGIGPDGAHRMLSSCRVHAGDAEVSRLVVEVEKAVGLATGFTNHMQLFAADVEGPVWDLPKALAFVQRLHALYSQLAVQESLKQVSEKYRDDPSCPHLMSERLTLVLNLEKDLLLEYGLEPNYRGILQRSLLFGKYPSSPQFMTEACRVCELQVPFVVLPCQQPAQAVAEDVHTVTVCEPQSSVAVVSHDEGASAGAEGQAIVVQGLKEEVDRLRLAEDAKDRQLAHLAARLAHQGEETAQVWSELLVRDREIDRLNDQIIDQGQSLSRMQAETSMKDRQIASLMARIADHSAEMAQAQGEVLATECFIADLTARIASQGHGVFVAPEARSWMSKIDTQEEAIEGAARNGYNMVKMKEELSQLRAGQLVRDAEIARLTEVSDRHAEETSQLRAVEQEREDEISKLESRLAAQWETIAMWRTEALDMDSEIAQLLAGQRERRTLAEHGRAYFGVEESHAVWKPLADGGRRGALRTWTPAWKQISSRFRSSAVDHSLIRVELVENSRLDTLCTNMLRLCETRHEVLGTIPEDWVSDPVKRQSLTLMDRHGIMEQGPGVVWAWHACPPSAVDNFVKMGFTGESQHAAPSYFASGYHCHLDAGHACRSAPSQPLDAEPSTDSCRCIVLVLVVAGFAYPLSYCPEDFHMSDASDPADCRHHGQPIRKPFDSHVVPLQRQPGGDYLIASQGLPQVHELIVDRDCQVLPFAICWFR